MLQGMIMDRPLLISSLLDYAVRYFGDREIVSVTADDPLHRTTYRTIGDRAKRLANALLERFEIKPGDRIATLAWNDHRHLEIYYGVSGIGAVCHTINPRLFADQIVYIVNHAADRVLFVDPMFWPLVQKLLPKMPTLEHVVVMTAAETMPEGSTGIAFDYETVLAGHSAELAWPTFDETLASGLCYTSGTTGAPKGVLYHHRSTVLHSFSIALPNALGIGADDVVLPVVPMFHVNAWGLPYACPMAGAKMVMPGPKLDGKSLCRLFNQEKVTLTAGVPTIWAGLLDHCAASGETLEALRVAVIGGSAPPPAMIERFENEHDVQALHGWGMTEMSPVGAVCRLGPAFAHVDSTTRQRQKAKQGRPLYGVEVKIVDEAGDALAGGWENRRAFDGPRPLDHVRLFRGRRGQRSGLRRPRLVLDRRHRHHRCAWVHGDHRPRQGHDQIRRRVDQLDRAREPGSRSPRGRRGRGHRRSPPEMGRAAASDCGQTGRRDGHGFGSPWLSRRQDPPSGSSLMTSSSWTNCRIPQPARSKSPSLRERFEDHAWTTAAQAKQG